MVLELNDYEKTLIKDGLVRKLDSLQDDYFIASDMDTANIIIETMKDIEDLINKLDKEALWLCISQGT